MKIPETNPSGAYYGNDENGQWQNGMVAEGAGAGDAAYAHPPHYGPPRHLPQPGYVMPGPYYPAGAPFAPPPEDFADYMWMEDEEDFDKQVMQQLEEEALMEQCIEAMLEDEQRERSRPVANGRYRHGASEVLVTSEQVSRSTLNPLAAEFVPTGVRASVSQDKSDIPLVSAAEPPPAEAPETERRAEAAESEHKSEPTTTTEVNGDEATTTTESDDTRPKERRDKKTAEPKKVKPEGKKKAAVAVKSEPKLPVTKKETKKEAKATKSVEEVKTEEVTAPVMATPAAVDVQKTAPAPAEEVPSGPKPINYAAAAKANKPKKASTPPVADKPAPPPPTSATKLTEKPTTKKAVVRKNSTK